MNKEPQLSGNSLGTRVQQVHRRRHVHETLTKIREEQTRARKWANAASRTLIGFAAAAAGSSSFLSIRAEVLLLLAVSFSGEPERADAEREREREKGENLRLGRKKRRVSVSSTKREESRRKRISRDFILNFHLFSFFLNKKKKFSPSATQVQSPGHWLTEFSLQKYFKSIFCAIFFLNWKFGWRHSLRTQFHQKIIQKIRKKKNFWSIRRSSDKFWWNDWHTARPVNVPLQRNTREREPPKVCGLQHFPIFILPLLLPICSGSPLFFLFFPCPFSFYSFFSFLISFFFEPLLLFVALRAADPPKGGKPTQKPIPTRFPTRNERPVFIHQLIHFKWIFGNFKKKICKFS